MIDELAALRILHAEQKKWRRVSTISFILIIAVSSFIFIVIPKTIPGLLFQVIMILSMVSVFGLVFLDRVSFILNKKFAKKDIVNKYLLQNSKPEDMHQDVEFILELVRDRRAANQDLKKL